MSETQTVGLVEWLTQILDEDEADVGDCAWSHVTPVGTAVLVRWKTGREEEYSFGGWKTLHAAKQHRVLGDIAAKRAIIALHVGGVSYPDECGLCSERLPCETVRLLASAYADRPGYDESWKP